MGRNHGTEVRHIVGCIANESGLSSSYIGRIRIHDEYTTVILPSGMPTDVMSQLSRAWVRGRQLNLKVLEGFDNVIKETGKDIVVADKESGKMGDC